MTEEVFDYQPILLLPNIRYPTYQLHAYAGAKQAEKESVLTIAVLETVKWLRQRFRAFDLPAELDLPDPEHYEDFDWSELRSFHLDMGYKLEVIWIEEQSRWVLQLTEPDLGARHGSGEDKRPPVPGRLFETNVSYLLKEDKVECAFKTVVHEPAGTTSPCEVFRLAFIKHLARNPLVRLHKNWPVTDKAHVLSTKGRLKRLQTWLVDPKRMLPALVAFEYTEKKQPFSLFHVPTIRAFDELLSFQLPKSRLPEMAAQDLKPRLPFAVSDFARYKMGYAQVFILPAGQKKMFTEMTGLPVQSGEALILEPLTFGGAVKRYPYAASKHGRKKVQKDIDQYIQTYPKGKDIDFGDCLFINDAKDLVHKQVLGIYQSAEEAALAYEEKTRTLENQHRERQNALRKDIQGREEKTNKLQEKIRELKMEKEQLRVELARQEKKAKKQLSLKEQEIKRWELIKERPQKPEEIPGWVKQFFEGRLIFHDRARDMITKVSPEKVNLPLLCDALEFLAEEYRDCLTGSLTEEERDQICSQKYGRPFEVVYSKGRSVEKYSADYKIKYYLGYKGKPVESALDLHLKVGNDPDNLLRIYFLYDKEKKRIVVGSLPEHLRTVSYN